ncbi:hypothetical protein HK405_016028, partial [Cladochytrium tenue]
ATAILAAAAGARPGVVDALPSALPSPSRAPADADDVVFANDALPQPTSPLNTTAPTPCTPLSGWRAVADAVAAKAAVANGKRAAALKNPPARCADADSLADSWQIRGLIVGAGAGASNQQRDLVADLQRYAAAVRSLEDRLVQSGELWAHEARKSEAQLRTRVARLEDALRDRDAAIQRATRDAGDRDRDAAELARSHAALERLLDAKDAEAAKHADDVDRRDARVAELEAELAQLRAAAPLQNVGVPGRRVDCGVMTDDDDSVWQAECQRLEDELYRSTKQLAAVQDELDRSEKQLAAAQAELDRSRQRLENARAASQADRTLLSTFERRHASLLDQLEAKDQELVAARAELEPAGHSGGGVGGASSSQKPMAATGTATATPGIEFARTASGMRRRVRSDDSTVRSFSLRPTPPPRTLSRASGPPPGTENDGDDSAADGDDDDVPAAPLSSPSLSASAIVDIRDELAAIRAALFSSSAAPSASATA